MFISFQKSFGSARWIQFRQTGRHLFDAFVFAVFLPVPLAQHGIRFLHCELAQLGGERVIVTTAADVRWRSVARARIRRSVGAAVDTDEAFSPYRFPPRVGRPRRLSGEALPHRSPSSRFRYRHSTPRRPTVRAGSFRRPGSGVRRGVRARAGVLRRSVSPSAGPASARPKASSNSGGTSSIGMPPAPPLPISLGSPSAPSRPAPPTSPISPADPAARPLPASAPGLSPGSSEEPASDSLPLPARSPALSPPAARSPAPPACCCAPASSPSACSGLFGTGLLLAPASRRRHRPVALGCLRPRLLLRSGLVAVGSGLFGTLGFAFGTGLLLRSGLVAVGSGLFGALGFALGTGLLLLRTRLASVGSRLLGSIRRVSGLSRLAGVFRLFGGCGVRLLRGLAAARFALRRFTGFSLSGFRGLALGLRSRFRFRSLLRFRAGLALRLALASALRSLLWWLLGLRRRFGNEEDSCDEAQGFASPAASRKRRPPDSLSPSSPSPAASRKNAVRWLIEMAHPLSSPHSPSVLRFRAVSAPPHTAGPIALASAVSEVRLLQALAVWAKRRGWVGIRIPVIRSAGSTITRALRLSGRTRARWSSLAQRPHPMSCCT